MRYVIFLLTIVLCSCESHQFDSDHRQVLAKNEIRKQVKNKRSFDVTDFKEDTLQSYTDRSFQHPIRYTLHFNYKDSTGATVLKRGEVLFTPDGKSIIHSQIIENNP